MAQNVEELAQILSRLQEENKINSEDVNKILVDIKSKVDYLNDNSDENSLLIDGLKEAFETKKSADIEKFSELEQSLAQIRNTLSTGISSKDFNNFLETLQTFEANFRQAVSGISYDKQSFFEGIQEELGRVVEKSVILKDLFPQKEQEALNKIAASINQTLNQAKQELASNVNGGVSALSENISSLTAGIDSLKNEIFHNTSANISVLSDDVKNEASKLDLGLSELKDVLSRNFQDSTRLIAGLNDANIKITDIIKTSEQNLEDNINNIKLSFDNLYKHFDEIKTELKQNSQENLNRILENIKENSTQITDFKESVSTNLSGYLTAIKELFITFSEEMKNSQDNLTADIFERKLQEMEVLSNDIRNLDGNLAQKEEGYQSYVSQKIEEVKTFLNSIQENVSSKNDKFDELQKVMEEYTSLVNNFASNTDIRFGEAISEITEIKDYIAGTSIKLDEIQNNISSTVNNNSEKIEGLTNTVSNQLNNVNTKLYSLSDELKQELTNSNTSLKELTGDINTNVSSNFNDVKTILECMRANISQCSDNISGKIEDYNNTINSNGDEQRESLTKLHTTIETALSLIGQNQVINNDKHVLIEQELKSNIEKINTLVNELTEQHKQTITDKCSEISADLKNNIRENSDSILQNIERVLSELEQAKNELSANQSINRNSIEQSLINNIKNAEETITEKNDKYSQDVAEKFNTISEYINTIKSRLEESPEETSDIAEQLKDYLLNIKNDINENVKNDFNSVAQSIGALLAQIENSKKDITANHVNSHSQLEQSVIANLKTAEENISRTTEQYTLDISEKISAISENINSLKSNLDEQNNNACIIDAKNEINKNLKADFNIIAQSIGGLLSKIETAKNDITANNVAGRTNLEQSIIANLKTTEEILTANTGKYSNEVFEKIETITGQLNIIKSELEETLHSSSSGSIEKLSSIEARLNEISDSYVQSLAELQTKLGDYITSVDRISEETNSKLDSSLEEFVDIKAEISKILEQINSIKDENSEDLSRHLTDILDRLTAITDVVSMSKTEISCEVKSALEENSVLIDKSLSYITISLDEIKTKQSENYDVYSSTFSEKLSSIKQELELVNTDVLNAINTKSEDFIKEFEPMKVAVDKFLEFDFNSVVSEIKNQVELSYLNLLSELKDNLIENHDSYIKIENTYKDIVSRCSSLEEYINSFTKDNLELINSTIANIDITVRSTLEKTNSFAEQWQKNFDAIETKISENSNLQELSLTSTLESLKTDLEAKIDTDSEELKECLAVMLNNDDLMLTLESLGGDITEKIEEYKSGIENTSNGLKDAIDSLNKDLSDKYDTIKQDLQTDKAAELAQTINDRIDNIIETLANLHDKVDVIAMSDNSEISEDINTSAEKILDVLEGLHNKVDVIAMSDDTSDNDEINDTVAEIAGDIKSLHNKIDILVTTGSASADNEETAETLNNIIDEIKSLHSKIDVLAMSDNSDLQAELDDLHGAVIENTKLLEQVNSRNNSEEITGKLTELFNSIDKTTGETDKISEMLKVLHEKVDILAMSDDTDIRDEIEDIKQLILEQRKLFEESDNPETAQEIENYLNQLLSDINKIEKGISEIDLEKNTQDIKDSVMTAILSVTDQISFVEETEEIKDFVEEKTSAINRTLLDVKKQLSNITNSGDDMDFYSYTLQDVETDIAKLRMILNDISTSNSTAEVGVISTNINRIVKSIEDLRNSLAQEDNFELKTDFEKLNEDILSISARTNKLLLNSDESYRILCDSMDEFNRRTSSLEERLNMLDNNNIENRLSMIDEKVEETVNSNKVLKNVMMYLGEWMDGTSETISGIYEKASKASSMREVLNELIETVPDKENLIKTIEDKFEEQQNRIDRLEKKLEKAISIIEENDQNTVLNKIDKLESQLSKLSLNIEKLASYVDE